MKIAVVGSGISGLSAAYYLSKKHHVDLFEREDHFGGHSHTIDLIFDEKKVSVDIGFIVFNFQTYPNLINFFKENDIPISLVISSEWCRCKETANIAFKNFETKNFLNSFYSKQFAKNKNIQIKNLRKYIDNWKSDKNLVLITHYVLISEVLDYAPSSGEIVIANKDFKKIGNFEIEY